MYCLFSFSLDCLYPLYWLFLLGYRSLCSWTYQQLQHFDFSNCCSYQELFLTEWSLSQHTITCYLSPEADVNPQIFVHDSTYNSYYVEMAKITAMIRMNEMMEIISTVMAAALNVKLNQDLNVYILLLLQMFAQKYVAMEEELVSLVVMMETHKMVMDEIQIVKLSQGSIDLEVPPSNVILALRNEGMVETIEVLDEMIAIM